MHPMDRDRWPCLHRPPPGHPEQCSLLLHVVPQAARSGTQGLHGDALKVRVAAPAVDGRANAAVLDWLAGQLGVPAQCLALATGQTSRRKRIVVRAPVERVEAWLATVLGPASPGDAVSPGPARAARPGGSGRRGKRS
jgi:uncharacterized protein (TIGR00251 family)